MRFRHRELGTYRISQLTPLIDVVFLLLIFFMVTSSFTAPESTLSSALKGDDSPVGRAVDLTPQIVHVQRSGDGAVTYRIGAHSLADRFSLTLVLRDLPKEGGVFIVPDADVSWAATAAALQAAEDAGFTKKTYVPSE